MVICLERGANDLHIVQLMPLPPRHISFIKILIGLTFLVPAYPRRCGKEAAKWVSVCLLIDIASECQNYWKLRKFFPICHESAGH